MRRTRSNLRNLVGRKFGNHRVLSYAGHKTWNVICIHGVKRTIQTGNLKVTKSCQCLNGFKNPLRRNKRQVSDYEAALQHLWKGYEIRARELGIVFNIPKEQFIELVLSPCHYCNTSSSNEHIRAFRESGDLSTVLKYNGLDRKDPELGYTRDNALPCCWPCNRAKGLLSYDEFFAYIQRIVATRPERF